MLVLWSNRVIASTTVKPSYYQLAPDPSSTRDLSVVVEGWDSLSLE